jgi:hypothetical protein
MRCELYLFNRKKSLNSSKCVCLKICKDNGILNFEFKFRILKSAISISSKYELIIIISIALRCSAVLELK